MKRKFYLLAALLLLPLVACHKEIREDSVQSWIYNMMTDYYLFYEDVPDRNSLNFNLSAEDFLRAAASPRDMKNGYCFSHIERSGSGTTANGRKVLSSSPCFGLEVAILRDNENRYYFRVLYTQKNSPAEEAGLKRGDWIIAVDGQNMYQNEYRQYISQPAQSYTFTLGERVNGEFQTVKDVVMPAPRYVEEETILRNERREIDGKKVAYILYNGFENDEEDFAALFAELQTNPVDHIILDLRYNPGGYVNTAQILCTYLAPAKAMGKPLFNMIYNDKINEVSTYTLDPSLLRISGNLSYQNLYIIATENTASASELVINCLRPYMKDKLFQAGTRTYGKNIAQSGLTDKVAPNITLWLTTCYLSNCEGFKDYFDNGLPADLHAKENLSGFLDEFAGEQDALCAVVFNHIAGESAKSVPETHSDSDLEEVDNTVRHKARRALTGCPTIPSATRRAGL